MWGPKVPRALHKGQLTVDLGEEGNFWIHSLEQQLPKNMKETVQAEKVTSKEIIPSQMEVAPLHCTVDITQKRGLFKNTKEIEKM